MVTEVPVIGATTRRQTARLPERLAPNWRTILACGDAAVILFVAMVTLNGASNRFAAAVVTAAIICGVFWETKYYRRSYAVFARDEAYYACAGVALAAIPVAVVLTAVAAVPLVSIVLTLIFSAVGTSAWRVRMHMERRHRVPPSIGIESITPGAWHDRESAAFRLSKRAFDVTVAAAALVLASPVMLLAALAVAREDGFPILFRQQRVGENGRPFNILKFRTMRADSGNRWVRPGDERITKTGAFLRRTSIDELPQLFNVLRGEMSIVGPRPEMVEFAQSFAQSIPNYEQRHVLAPGITGWAQLYCKRNLDPADMPGVVPCDLFYIEHASVLLDAALVLKTAFEVIFHRAV